MKKTLVTFLILILSPSLAFAAGDGHGPALWLSWTNFIVFFVLLLLLLKKPMAAFWGDRRASYTESILKSEKELEAALKELEAARSEYANVSQEIQTITSNIKKETELEIERNKQDITKQAERIIQQAKHNADSEQKAKEAELQSEFATKVCEVAKEKLQKEFGSDYDKEYREAGLNGIKSLIS